MMKKTLRMISLLLALVMTLTLVLTSCDWGKDDDDDDAATDDGSNYTLPLEDGYNQITFYWTYNIGDYANCDMWIWFPGADGQGYLFHECTYGAKVVVNVPEDVTEVGFIVRKNCSDPGGTSWGDATKDYDGDRFAIITGRENVVYLKPGDANQYKSDDGGKTLTMIKNFAIAGIDDKNQITYSVTPKLTGNAEIKVYEGDRELTITNHNLNKSTVTLSEDLDLSKNYRISIEGYGEKEVVPRKIFDSTYFADNFHYDGDDLGAVIDGDNTTFKVWAPTASKVVLNLFTAGNGVSAYKNVEMVKGDKGVWSHTEECGHGTYYTYTVTTSVGTQEAVDPYAKAAGVNGQRGMVVDLDSTDPEGWDGDGYVQTLSSYSDAVLWEVHVRDFSNKIESSQYKGKYLAFTETGLTNEHGQAVGIDYLKNLGITHVHLLPVYDYASVDETKNTQFNWGYDPQNYNVPEGSYSTNPYDGEVRINEYKQMVAALHEAGIGVVMDMVYNHTYDKNSNLNKVVPYYYYRYNDNGENTSGSGCGNDTASERYMFSKYMVDSTSYWVEEYHLDGLRFDLMGLHDIDTMQNVETAVHEINPKAILYGEAWPMTSSVASNKQANQSNISKVVATGNAIGAIAVFNDATRDALKGSVFSSTSTGFISGSAKANWRKVVFGILGGNKMNGTTWKVNDSMVINYMSAHDNNTLWDKLAMSTNVDDATRNKMNNLGAAINLISKGTPFWQAGEEMLRTKVNEDGSFNENSYNASDSVNNIDWSVLDGESMQYNTMLYYKGLIEMRRSFSVFTSASISIECEELGSGICVVKYLDGENVVAIAYINPYSQTLPVSLPDGNWNLVADGTQAGSAVLRVESGSTTSEGISIRVYVSDSLLTK